MLRLPMFSAVAAIADFAYPFPTNIPDGRAASTLAGNPGPLYRIAQASGLVAQNLRRFLRGGVSIRLDNADKLADCLGLRLLLTPDENPLGPTLTEAMKVAIQRNGLPVYRIAWATGISAVHLSRFLRDEESIRLDTADRLAAYLGLQLVPDPDAKPPEPTPANLARPTLAKTKTRAKAKRKAN